MRYISDKYFYRLDEPTIREEYKDRAVSRKILEFGIGLLPLSAHQFTQEMEDRFVRVTVNRNYEVLDLVISAFKDTIS